MLLVLSLAAEIVAMLATVAVGYVLLLSYQNPARPGWMRGELASTLLAILGIGLAVLATAWFVAGLTQAGLDPLGSLTAAGTVLVVGAWGLWRIMDMKRRMADAARGRSPFAARDTRDDIAGGGLAS